MSNVNRRDFLQVGAALPAAQAARSQNAERPNVLFIMTDQHRLDCLGANGNPIIRTPNLDRLASGAARFSNLFVQAPVCVPSRISYFTGRYPHSHKNRVNYTPCDPKEVMLQRLLHEAPARWVSCTSTDPFSDYVRWRKANDPNPDPHYWLAFALPDAVAQGQLRPLRSGDAPEEE